MKKIIIFLLPLCAVGIRNFAQQLPLGTCGIVNVYDAAGNRTKRVYFCNNGDPYPTRPNTSSSEATEFQPIDALYPNPTTGKFSITFSRPMQNASVAVTDVNGKVFQQFKVSGSQANLDLSGFAAGVYFVRIEENGKVITKKVIKQ